MTDGPRDPGSPSSVAIPRADLARAVLRELARWVVEAPDPVEPTAASDHGMTMAAVFQAARALDAALARSDAPELLPLVTRTRLLHDEPERAAPEILRAVAPPAPPSPDEWLDDLDLAIELGERTAWEPYHGGTLAERSLLVALTAVLRATVPAECPAALRVAVETPDRGSLPPAVVPARDAVRRARRCT